MLLGKVATESPETGLIITQQYYVDNDFKYILFFFKPNTVYYIS